MLQSCTPLASLCTQPSEKLRLQHTSCAEVSIYLACSIPAIHPNTQHLAASWIPAIVSQYYDNNNTNLESTLILQWSTLNTNTDSTKQRRTQNMCSGLGCMTTSQTDPPPKVYLLGANWWPWHFKLKLSLSQKVGWTAETVTQSGTSVWDARYWRTFCHVGSKLAWTLSCNPAQVPKAFFPSSHKTLTIRRHSWSFQLNSVWTTLHTALYYISQSKFTKLTRGFSTELQWRRRNG